MNTNLDNSSRWFGRWLQQKRCCILGWRQALELQQPWFQPSNEHRILMLWQLLLHWHDPTAPTNAILAKELMIRPCKYATQELRSAIRNYLLNQEDWRAQHLANITNNTYLDLRNTCVSLPGLPSCFCMHCGCGAKNVYGSFRGDPDDSGRIELLSYV